MQRSPQDSQSNFESTLRDQLIAAQNDSQNQGLDAPQPSSAGPPAYHQPGPPEGEGHNIDPSMGGPGGQDYSMEDMNIDDAIAAMGGQQRGGGPRRELSSSKRAAQNRAAQRAFRQRKEAYIGKLEKQVKDYRTMEEDFKTLQQENYQLREYILTLQSRFIDTSSELPPLPAQISLQQPVLPPQAQLGSASQHPRPEEPPQQPPERPVPSPAHISPETRPLPQPQAEPTQSTARQYEPSQFRPIFETHDQDRQMAPTADMMTSQQPAGNNESISQAAVEQLQAAAAEADGLGADDRANIDA